MTPHHLHALAAAHSLAAARAVLAAHATAEAAHIAAERLEPADCLRSPAWGRRHALGGHGDPTATTYLTGGVPYRVNRPRALADDITAQLFASAQYLPATSRDPLARILDAIPAMSPRAADATTHALTRLDEVARRFLRIGPDRQPLPGVPCPGCDHRTLTVQTAGPEQAWTVVCLNAGHVGDRIWRRDDVLRAVAGAAPTHTN